MAEKKSPDTKRSGAEFDLRNRAIHDDLYYHRLGKARSGGGSGGTGTADTREMQLGAELDPKTMMKRKDMKKGGAVKSASARADGIAQRGKTRA